MAMQNVPGNAEPVRAEKSEGLTLRQSASLGENPYFPSTPAGVPTRATDNGSPDGETGPDGDAGSSADHQVAGDVEESFLDNGEQVDTESPGYKKLFASYTRQRQKDKNEIASLKNDFARQLAELKSQIQTPRQQVPEGETSNTEVDEDGLRVAQYRPFQFKPDSTLAGYEDDIKEASLHYIREAVRDLREQSEQTVRQQQQQTTRQKLEGFVSGIPADKYAQAEALFREHAQVAVQSPEAFIRLATYELGLNEQAPVAESQNGRVAPTQLADKRRAAVPRPSQSATSSSSRPFQAKSIEEAIDYACQVHGVSR